MTNDQEMRTVISVVGHWDWLRDLGRSTGGEAIFEGDSRKLARVFADVARAIRGLYFVSYEPSNAEEGWHEIKVKVDRRGARLRHRPGYPRVDNGQRR